MITGEPPSGRPFREPPLDPPKLCVGCFVGVAFMCAVAGVTSARRCKLGDIKVSGSFCGVGVTSNTSFVISAAEDLYQINPDSI